MIIKRILLSGIGVVVAGLAVSSVVAIGTGDNNDALRALARGLADVVEDHPGDASTMLRLASIHEQLGEFDLAGALRQQAAAIDPGFGVNDGPEFISPERGLGATGQDVWVCDLPNVQHWTSGGAVDGFRVYSIATTSANGGDARLDWIPGTDPDPDEQQLHPVIAQNLYRYSDGRLEQIGMSWLKHGFCALQQNGCGSCTSTSNGCPPWLDPGCSDPYSAALNGTQFRLGPRSGVNAVSGEMALPIASPGTGVLDGRIQVLETDLTVDGARYLIEGQYIHQQDIASNNQLNNASWREVNVIPQSFFLNFPLGAAGTTRQQQQAIFAWISFEAGVQIKHVDVPSDGRFTVGYKVSGNGDGTWRYEYAVTNFNSERAAGAFSVPIPDGVTVTGIGFHDVDHHSGDGLGGVTYDGTDWTATLAGGELTWETDSFGANPNANALRWSTLYNFWFDADAAPTDADATITLFAPGTPADMTVVVSAPEAAGCFADLNGDGIVNALDLAFLLGAWSAGDLIGDLSGDGNLSGADLALLLGAWGQCV